MYVLNYILLINPEKFDNKILYNSAILLQFIQNIGFCISYELPWHKEYLDHCIIVVDKQKWDYGVINKR